MPKADVDDIVERTGRVIEQLRSGSDAAKETIEALAGQIVTLRRERDDALKRAEEAEKRLKKALAAVRAVMDEG